MPDEFDYDPPEGPLDCCSGMSRHGRLLQEARTPLPLPPASAPAQRAGIQQRRLTELMQQLKRQPPQPESFRG